MSADNPIAVIAVAETETGKTRDPRSSTCVVVVVQLFATASFHTMTCL